jgi:hypothetical protein
MGDTLAPAFKAILSQPCHRKQHALRRRTSVLLTITFSQPFHINRLHAYVSQAVHVDVNIADAEMLIASRNQAG